MSVRRHLGFGSTPNLRNLIPTIIRNTDSVGRFAYANYDPTLGEPPTDTQKALLESYECILPTLTFTGSEKLHGENMAVCYSQGEIWVQGRNHIRTLIDDQNGMAEFVDHTKTTWNTIFALLEGRDDINTNTHTIVIDCEWAGGNIQKGNAACSGTDKGAYIFDYYRAISNEDDSEVLYPTTGISYESDGIYNMASFSQVEVTLDFNNIPECRSRLEKLATIYEEKSPIAAYFNKPNNIGEGVYLYCLATDDHPTYRLKAKGEKHGGKPKQSKDPKDPELHNKLSNLAEAVTPVWRITQGITEIGATEMKHTGELIKWVLADIVKEELLVLQDAGVDFKQVSGYVSKIVAQYYKSTF